MPPENDLHLPMYANPPVVETILGVQFAPISGLTSAHLGAFWNSLDRSMWPKVADAPPIEPQFERFDSEERWGMRLQFQLSPFPTPRIQIRNADNDRMIQVQNGRLHFNWLKVRDVSYPRYPMIKGGFEEVLGRFSSFLGESGLSPTAPNQWEVTYINHIPIGTVWNSPLDWGFFRLLRHVDGIAAIALDESFNGEWHFILPENKGRLHVSWRHAKNREDGNEFINLTLTARGPIGEDSAGGSVGLTHCLDIGRATIVRAFAALMSDEANQFWGMQS